MTRAQIWRYVKREKVFEGLIYPTENYPAKEDGFRNQVDSYILSTYGG